MEIVEGFDKSLDFTRVRFDLSKNTLWGIYTQPTYDDSALFSEMSNNPIPDGFINIWSYTGDTYGYGTENRFSLYPGYLWYSSRVDGFTDHKIADYGTHIADDIYEVEYPTSMYWGALATQNYQDMYAAGIGVSVYADAISIAIEPSSLDFGYAASSTTLTLTLDDSTVSWTATTIPSWISLSQSEGTGTTTITVSASKNTSSLPRTGTLIFEDGDDNTVEVSVSQEKYPLIVPINNMLFGGE